MKKYVKTEVTFIFLDRPDVCTTSGDLGGNETQNAGGNLNATFNDYDFGGTWL